jgi:hypothetical protein
MKSPMVKTGFVQHNFEIAVGNIGAIQKTRKVNLFERPSTSSRIGCSQIDQSPISDENWLGFAPH